MSDYHEYKDRTNYPEIFESSYWGRFRATDEAPEHEIVANRNALVRDYGLVKRNKTTYPKYVTEHFGLKLDWPYRMRFWDHLEVYESKDEWIVICSVYGPMNYEIWQGFEPIAPVHSLDAKSYLGRVPKRRRGTVRSASDSE